jgi:hypothetical protein
MEPLAEWTYSCTEEEIYRCLKRGELRRAGPVRVGIQTAVLLLLTAYCLIGYFTGDRSDARPLVVGILAAMLAIILLFVPEWRFRHDAAREAALEKQMHVFLFESGLAFGTPEEILPFAECRPRLFEDMAVLRFQGGALAAIPRRAMTGEEWGLLCEKLQAPMEKGG